MKFESQLQIVTAAGVPPFTVNQTALVINLNADLLDGQHGAYFENRDATALGFSGGVLTITRAAGNLTANLDGRYLPLTGGAMTGTLALHSTGANGFYNGNGDAATYALYNFKLGGWNGMALENLSTGGTYPSQVVGVIDFRGGTIDMKGGFKVNGTAVLTGNQSISITGDASGTGTTSINLTLANSGVAAGTYRSVTVDAKGRVTAGTNPTTLAGYGITDALPLTGGTITGNTTFSGDNHLTFGPNSTWSNSIRIGGNGYTATGTQMASVATTNGNLHLDSAKLAGRGVYLNWYGGTAGTYFGNGSSGQVGLIDGSGNASFSGALSIGGNASFVGQITGAYGPTLSFYGNACDAASYNYVLGAANDTGNKLVIFVNGSTRTADGGVNSVTIRNDAGPLNLGLSSYVTNIFGSSVAVSGALSATSFSGLGTGLTGTAASLNIGGNAATATTLQTARTINGTSFNGSANIDTTEWIHSLRDFTNGTLITTSINYAVTNGDPFVLEVTGNSYGNLIPLNLLYQGYIYSDTIINHGGLSNGYIISGLVALNVGGNLCFWFPNQGYWNGYNVKVYVAYEGRATNRVASITNVVKPTGTKEVALSANIRQSLHSSNFSSYALPLTGGTISGNLTLNGHLTSGAGYQVRWSDGSAASPGYSFYADTDTGIHRPADNTLAIVTAGVTRATVGPTGTLNVVSALTLGGNPVLSEAVVTFTPTTVGWYRIATAGGNSSGTIRIAGFYDNRSAVLEFDYTVNGWNQGCSINLRNNNTYAGSLITQIRASNDVSTANGYLDIYIATATAPAALTIYNFGPARAGLVASPVVGAVVGTNVVKIANINNVMGYVTTGPINADTMAIVGNGTVGGTLAVTGAITQAGNQVLHAGNYGGYSTFSGVVTSGSGFQTATYSAGRNRIWSFGNSDNYGLSYFQGGVINGQDVIGLHFGTATAAGSQFQFLGNGSFNATGTITAPTLKLTNGFEIQQGAATYGQFNNWVHLNGSYGFYSGVNNAHIYPNNGSYGAWRIQGTRNGWGGIEFENNGVSLMMGSDTVGFHQNTNGWLFRVHQGVGYIYKGSWGGGTAAAILDSSNVGTYALPIGGGTITGNLTINGTLSEGGYQAFPERVYTINLSAQSAANFYPIVLDASPGSDVWHHRFSLEMPSLGGAAAYNMDHFHGEARGQGWSDQTSFYRIFHNCYDNAERFVLGLWRGTQNWFGIVLYVRGGQTYYVRTTSRSVTGYTAAVTLNSNATFAIKNAAGADVSGTSANIAEMFNAINTAQGFHSSYNNYIGGTQVVTNTGTWGISISGTATTATTANALNTSNNYQVNSIGVGMAGSGTAGSISLNQVGTRSWSIVPSGGNLNFASGDGNGAANFSVALQQGGQQVLHAGNYTSYAPGLGTFNQFTNTNYFRSNKGSGVYLGTTNTPPLQAFSDDGGAAFMSFHRGGAYAVNFGLDPDNVLRIGGWSASANRWQLDMSGNNTIAGSLTAVGGIFSGTISQSIYSRRQIPLAGPGTANFGNWKQFIRLWAATGSGANLFTLKVSVRGQWNWSTAFGTVEAYYSLYLPADSTISAVRDFRITHVSGPATDNIRLGDAVIENGFVSIPVWCSNTNALEATVEQWNGSAILGTTTTAVSEALPAFIAPNFRGGLTSDGNAVAHAGNFPSMNTYATSIGNTYPDRVFMSNDANIKYAPINTAKTHLGLTAKYGNSRANITGDSNYWTGVMGWGNTDWNTVFDWGSGFTESWDSPANKPPDTSHHCGIQAVHYTNGTARYGWQMANGVGTNRWWLRDVWGGVFSSWREVIHSGNYTNYPPARWATGRTISITGDVTGTSGTFDGTANLSFGVTIANSAVTYAKIQNVAVSSVLGNSSASVAQAPQALSMATLAGMLSGQTMNIAGSSTSCTGNAATATNLSANRTNWVGSGVITAVVGQLAWKNYNNNHTIFDASASTAPDGSSVNNTNAQVAWTGTYPTLMGWNGANTYGVRVDSARVADGAPWSGITSKPTTFSGYGISDIAYGSTGSRNVWQVSNWNQTTYPNAHFLSSESNATNAPTADFTYGLQTSFHRDGSAYRTQIVTELYSNPIALWARNSGNSDAFTAWVKLLHSSNYNDYAPTKTGGGASGTWGINITGSSTSCSGSAAQLNGQAASYYENRDTTAVGISAGTLTLTRAAGNLTTTIGGRVVAWCEFNGNFASTGSPNAAFNVSSITKNATGDYTINFTSALANTNYVVAGYARVDTTNNTTNYNLYIGVARRSTAKTTTSCRIGCEWVNSTLFDAESVGVAFIAA